MTFDPNSHPNLLFYIPSQAAQPSRYFKGNNSDGGAAAAAGDLVGTIQTGIVGVNFTAPSIAPSTEYRFPLADSGYGYLSTQGTTARGLRHNSTSYAKAIHETPKMFFVTVFIPSVGMVTTRPIITNHVSLTSTATANQGFGLSTQGFVSGVSTGGIYRKTSGSVARVDIKNANATPLIDLYLEDDLYQLVPSPMVFMGYIQPTGLSWARVGQGRKCYGQVSGTPYVGNAAYNTILLNRADFTTQFFPGQFITGAIYSDYPGDAAVAEWLAEWPLSLSGISGSSELKVGTLHYNPAVDLCGSPYCIWYNGQRVTAQTAAGAEGDEGVVINDGVSTDYLGGSAGWCGGPHKNETLTSFTISLDGAAAVNYSNGQLYEATTSIRTTRTTELGVSFYHTEVSTLTANSRQALITLQRRNDGRTINPAYIRTSRPAGFADFVAFDINGNTLHDSTVSASDFTCDQGTVAIAQWSPTTGQMALFMMLQGYSLAQTWLIIYSVDGRRIYIRLDGINSTTNGQIITAETVTKYYTTDASSWKALARRELLNTLYPRDDEPGLSTGLGLGI